MVLYGSSEEIGEIRKKVEEIVALENNCTPHLYPTSLIEKKKEIMTFIDEHRGGRPSGMFERESKRTRAEAIVFEIVNLMPHKTEIKHRYAPKTVLAYVEEECVLDELEKQKINIDQVLEGKVSFAWLQSLNWLCNLPEAKKK
jgi:hypothetical protein